MDNLPFEKIQIASNALSAVDPKATYHKSYTHFIKFFANKSRITEHDLIIAANFVYGWMPTILTFKSNDFEVAIEIVNRARGDERISKSDFLALKELINNSVVGASKILHFINPNHYAIWDSRVCRFLTGKMYSQKVENIDRYWSYLDLCAKITADHRFRSIHEDFIKQMGYQITPMRTIEQIMFSSSNAPLGR